MLWDISPPVQPGSPVFPGDTPYQQQWAATLGPGCPVNVGTLTLSPHVGAHADAPLHYDPTGASVGELDLAPYLGPCRVIHAIGVGPLIEWSHLAHAIGQLPPRVLVRTYARTAETGLRNAAMIASPMVLTMEPPSAVTACSRISKCSRTRPKAGASPMSR